MILNLEESIMKIFKRKFRCREKDVLVREANKFVARMISLIILNFEIYYFFFFY